MCRFITAVIPVGAVPAGAELETLRAIFHAHGRVFGEYSDPVLAAQLARDERCVLTTPGHCDCGTPLGARCESDLAAENRRREAHLARLRRRGWSEVKIARAMAQHDTAAARERVYSGHESPQTSLAQWLALLDEALATTRIPWIGLMLGMYRGAIESEAVALLGREVVDPRHRTRETLAAMRERVLYEFRRGIAHR